MPAAMHLPASLGGSGTFRRGRNVEAPKCETPPGCHLERLGGRPRQSWSGTWGGPSPRARGSVEGAIKTVSYVFMSPSTGYPIQFLFFIGNIPPIYSFIYLFNKVLSNSYKE